MQVTGFSEPYKKRFVLVIFILSFFVFYSKLCFSQSYPNPQVDSLLTTGINELLNQNYQKAENLFSTLDKNYPKIPLGKIYLAALEISKSFDLKLPYKTDYIDSNLNEALKLSEARYENDNSTWNKYFVGLSKGYLSYFAAINRNWLSALNQGYDAIKDFDNCLSQDSSFFDCYTAIGTFEYWKSKKTEFLSWLPFLNDESQEGINLLKKAVNHKSYNRYLAIYSLQWIFINEKKYRDVVEISEKALKDYPKSRFFKWALGRAYEEIDHKKAIDVYQEILKSYEKDTLTAFNNIVLKHLIAQQYEKIGEFEKSFKLCDEILKVKDLGSYHTDYLERRMERVRKLRAELLDKINGKKIKN